MEKLTKYWLFTLFGTLAVSLYPVYMGLRVIRDMAVQGTVMEENYPKYIIPYAPIAIAVIVAVVLMPLLFRLAGRMSVWAASALAAGVFFVSEWLFESKVIVTATVKTTLESWQMYMCVMPPGDFETRTWRAVDILIGEYSPVFKLHFYLISVILILTVINVLYGFAWMLQSGNRARCRALAVQSVCTALFLGLCIFACFTAFFRDGELTVSAVSAVLMGLFFVLMGVTAGVYAGSFLLGRKRGVSVLLPAGTASLTVLAMYIGEMSLLDGHLYRFGSGFFFQGIGAMTLAPADILIIVSSGAFSAVLCHFLNYPHKGAEKMER